MSVLLPVALFALGVVVIMKGGDLFVDASCWMAEVSGIPKFIIGATVVSIATTLPEMLVSAIAAFQGNVDVTVGNAVGTVTANTGLIMGFCALLAPAVVERSGFQIKALLLLTAAAVLTAFGLTGTFGLLPSILLLIIFVLYAVESILLGRMSMANETKKTFKKTTFAKNLARFVIGAAGIVWGADLLVDNGVLLAELFGVPEAVIAATLIAVGTSLPELVTMISSLRKGHASLSLGNIIGANVLDLTLILPISVPISGSAIQLSAQSRYLDLPVMNIVLAVLVLPTLMRSKLSRWQGGLMLLIYGVYLVLLLTMGVKL